MADLERGQDKWSDWLLRRRCGGDEAVRAQGLERLKAVRDRVLENAQLSGEEVLLDVGTGDGLIGLGALEVLRPPNGMIIFSDVSQPCLDYVAQLFTDRPAKTRVSFDRLSADDLSTIASETVDVVTTRSVLIYVKNKEQAMREFFRALRSGGRISLAEPLNRDRFFIDQKHKNEFYGYDLTPIADLVQRVNHWDTAANLDDNPMTDFTYLDLLTHCERAGFSECHIDVRLDLGKRQPRSWESFVNFSPNPNARSIGEEFRSLLSAEECDKWEQHLRPLVESGQGAERTIMAYIWAVKN